MVSRIQKLSKNDGLFIFGARGTGKSTLVKSWDKKSEAVVWSQDSLSKEIQGVKCHPWQIGFAKIFST